MAVSHWLLLVIASCWSKVGQASSQTASRLLRQTGSLSQLHLFLGGNAERASWAVDQFGGAPDCFVPICYRSLLRTLAVHTPYKEVWMAMWIDQIGQCHGPRRSLNVLKESRLADHAPQPS